MAKKVTNRTAPQSPKEGVKGETQTVEQKVETPDETQSTETVESREAGLEEKALELMKLQNVEEIWRCPVTGYWFTKKENAVENAGKVKKEAEHYKL